MLALFHRCLASLFFVCGEYTPNGRFEMQNRCAEIKIRAERRAGEILAAYGNVNDAVRLSQTPVFRSIGSDFADVN